MVDYTQLIRSVYDRNAAEVEHLVRAAIAEGRSPREVLDEGLITGMRVVGEDFKQNVVYVPEVLVAARAMKAGLAILKPLLGRHESTASRAGVIVLGTVRGDLHDIGKNLVGVMAEGAGFDVHDIGVDQSAQKFLAAAERCQPAIVAMSALLTTTMGYMETVIGSFRAAGLGHVKFAVGGAPVTQAFADRIGADGYAEHATAAVALFRRLAARP
jgi:methanogenic corrinoid protein MtbC1